MKQEMMGDSGIRWNLDHGDYSHLAPDR